MSLTIDANVLVRIIVEDNVEEALVARNQVADAQSVIVPLVALCETNWVLKSVYKLGRAERVSVIKELLRTRKIVLDRPAVEAGLVMLEAGGDFADGVIAFDGARLGGETFATFDRRAADLLLKSGHDCRLLAAQSR